MPTLSPSTATLDFLVQQLVQLAPGSQSGKKKSQKVRPAIEKVFSFTVSYIRSILRETDHAKKARTRAGDKLFIQIFDHEEVSYGATAAAVAACEHTFAY